MREGGVGRIGGGGWGAGRGRWCIGLTWARDVGRERLRPGLWGGRRWRRSEEVGASGGPRAVGGGPGPVGVGGG